MTKLKRLDFSKNDHKYSVFYDDVTELIDYLVDISDGKRSNLDISDTFGLVRHLAKIKS